MTDVVARAVAALRRGDLVVLPTDTVYGLAAAARLEAAALALYRLKGRTSIQPTAIVAAVVDDLVAAVPELAGRPEALARAVLPGAYTLVLPNPAQRLPWLNGERPQAIGVRVPLLGPLAGAIVHQGGPVVATSANLPGGADPRSAAEIPEQIAAGVAAVVDGGRLPGVPSTVIDCTGGEPVVLRAGAGPVEPALERLSRVG